ncbi:hypothetical protein [Burkholderia cenocepacia]|uniref:hypothetical protein n=1 Tax=Burkholderia cenocepacia TaxID=95486 RepID=UPI00158CD068|nr:hypothetical protein [Burkholderia cenocepacia]
MKKTRAPDLTEQRIKVVIDTLDGWKGKLTWDLLLDAIEKSTGFRYSRFTFAEYPEIANAFSLKKDMLRGTWAGERSQPRDKRVRGALEQVERYKAKVERLEQENRLLLEQFVTWATNAERKGVTMAMLDAPLPKPERDRTKTVK